MSWHGRVLRVDLSAGTTRVEALNERWAEQYLGARGLATRYLYDEVDPRTDPLAPEMPLIFATGPLTGTRASTGGRWTVVTKGALTDAIACSNSGGKFGAELKYAGYDLVIITGRSERPVYYWRGRRSGGALRLHRQRSASGRWPVGCGCRDGSKAPQGDSRAWNSGGQACAF